MRLLSARKQQEIAGYATGFILLGGVISVMTIVGSLELPEQAKNAVNGMAVALILIMAYQARSYMVHQPKFAHVMQVFENEENAWEIHGVLEATIPLSEDKEAMEVIKLFGLGNKHVYGMKYSSMTVFGTQSFQGQKFAFHDAIMCSEVSSGELYGKGIKHEIDHKSFPATPQCALLTVDMLKLINVPKTKGITDEDWIPVFYVRHGPYHSSTDYRLNKRFQELPAASPELVAAGGSLASRLVSIQIEGKVLRRIQEARTEGIEIGAEEGDASIRDFEAGIKSGGPSLRTFKLHPRLSISILALAVLGFGIAYLVGWLRI